jgi:hypothetical protein
MANNAESRAARADILDILALYCHAIDRRRWDLMAGCFHDDATYRFGSIDGSWQDFVVAARAVIDPLRISHHQLGQTFLAINGNVADAETYMTAYHRVAGDAPADAVFPGTGVDRDIIIAGRYIDRLERRENGWRIARRIGVTDWRQEAGATDSGLFALPQEWRGDIGPGDPAHTVTRMLDQH